MAPNVEVTGGLAEWDESLSILDFYMSVREKARTAWEAWPATCECDSVKPSDLPPTRANLIGTVVWAVLLSFSAVVKSVLSWQRGDTFIAFASAAQLLVTLVIVALIVARWRKPRPHLSLVKPSQPDH